MRYSKLEKKLIKDITSYEIKNYDVSFKELFQDLLKNHFDNSGIEIKNNEIMLYLKKESNDKLQSYKYKLIALIILLRTLEKRKLIYFIKKEDKIEYKHNPLYKNKKTPLFKININQINYNKLIQYIFSDFYISENLKEETKFKILTKNNIALLISILAFLISLGGGIIDFFDLGKPQSIRITK